MGAGTQVAGPALIYVGLPRTIASLVRASFTVQVLQAGNRTTTLVPGLGSFSPPPGGSRVTSVPPTNTARIASQASAPQPVNLYFINLFRTITPVLFGVCEDTPDVTFDPNYIPYYRDEGGRSTPSDRIFDGEEGAVVADLNVFNEGVYSFLQARAAGGLLNTAYPRGINGDGHIGTLMNAESAALPLWVVFPYAAKPHFAAAGMPPAYRFYASLVERDGLGNLNTKVRKIRVAWRCQQVLIPNYGTALYDHDIRGLPRP